DLNRFVPVPAHSEHQLFPGIVAVVGARWALADRRPSRVRPLASSMLLSAAIVTAVTLDVGGVSLFRGLFWLPGFDSMRAIARVVLVTMFPLSVLVGLLLDRLVTSPRMRWRVVAAALAILLVAESSLIAPRWGSKEPWRDREAALIRQLPSPLPRGSVLAVRTDKQEYFETQETAQLVALAYGIVTINGHSGNFPDGWLAPATCADVGLDLRLGRRFLLQHGWPAPTIAPQQLVLIGFGDCDRAALLRDPVLTLGEVYPFGAGQAGNGFVDSGFSGTEAWGRWIEGSTGRLVFTLPAPPPGPVAITLDTLSFSAEKDFRQTVDIDVNGRACGSLMVWAGHLQGKVVCPAGALRPGRNAITFAIRHPARPIDVHFNSDPRLLGLGLRTMVLDVAK
ncbi:MAG: hypothetical protein ACREFC_11210, partial [Stellaceae bacterium]